ncbi:MAG: nicotinamide mononucleotide transporter [Clostridia bacterium]|nr:nicotinamide mononucleotide transporter [Clostridia bacterium]
MKKSKQIFDYLLMAAVAVMIIVFAVLRGQSFLKTLPTLITLAVQMLLVNANRYAFLLGGANALLYGISYLSEGLYFSLISAVVISAPIQFYSFFVWSKNKDRSRPELKVLGIKRLLPVLAVSLLGWVACYFGLSQFFAGQSYPLLDTYIFAMSITVSILAARQFVDSQYISAVSSMLSLLLWILLTVKDPANFNYIIISSYNLFRIVQAAVTWTKKYFANRKETAKESTL